MPAARRYVRGGRPTESDRLWLDTDSLRIIVSAALRVAQAETSSPEDGGEAQAFISEFADPDEPANPGDDEARL